MLFINAYFFHNYYYNISYMRREIQGLIESKFSLVKRKIINNGKKKKKKKKN